MFGKACLFLCLQAVLLQSISVHCGKSSSCGCSEYDGFSKTATYTTGGPVTVTCSGPLASNGLNLVTDLSMQGKVDVCGSMPFLSAVSVEGTLPTSGYGAVEYGCGDGSIVILQESGNPSGSNAASRSGLTPANLAQCGCGCRH